MSTQPDYKPPAAATDEETNDSPPFVAVKQLMPQLAGLSHVNRMLTLAMLTAAAMDEGTRGRLDEIPRFIKLVATAPNLARTRFESFHANDAKGD